MDSQTGSMAELGTADNSLSASADNGLNNISGTGTGTEHQQDQPSLDVDIDIAQPQQQEEDDDQLLSDPSALRVTLFPFVDPSKTTKPVMFDPIERVLRNGSKITIGRRVEPKGDDGKRKEDGPFVTVEDGFIGFKSKVVSRSHAEIWVKDGQLYFKDIGSSSGTFLNRMRLSPSARESRPYPLKDSDVIQLGVDYQNRPEDIYKAIVMRVLVQHPDGTKKQVNPMKLHAALKSLIAAASPLTNRSDDPNSSVDCAICLNCIAPFQALFLAPCSHCFHFKCIKPLLEAQGVMFLCPMCRQVANLEASVSSENLLEGFDEAGSTTQESDTEDGGADGAAAPREHGGNNNNNNNEQTLGRAAMAEALAAANGPAAARSIEDRMDVDAEQHQQQQVVPAVVPAATITVSRSTNSLAASSVSVNSAGRPGEPNITINFRVSGGNLVTENSTGNLANAAAANNGTGTGASASPATPTDPNAQLAGPAGTDSQMQVVASNNGGAQLVEVKHSAPGSPAREGASGSGSGGAGPAFTFRFSIERSNNEQ